MAYNEGASSGNLVLIQKQTASNSASIEFKTGISGFSTVLFVYENVIPGTDVSYLHVVVSNDGGASYVVTNYTAGCKYIQWDAVIWANTSEATQFDLTTSMPSAGIGTSGSFHAVNVGIAANCQFYGMGTFPASAASQMQCVNGGSVATNSVNAFKFAFNAGNIASGTFKLYGV
jgi:hypothetical protein